MTRVASATLRHARPQRLNQAERLAVAGVLLTPILLLLDYRGHTAFWTHHVYFKSFGYGGAIFEYDEVFGLTQTLWFALAVASAVGPRTRDGFRTVTSLCLFALAALLLTVTAAQGGVDGFAVHALATSFFPVLAASVVLTNPRIEWPAFRIAIVGFAIFVAVVVAASIARDVRGSLRAPPTIANYVDNSSFEQGTGQWLEFAHPPATARLSVVAARSLRADGVREAELSGRNPATFRQKIFAYTFGFPAVPGNSYYVRAFVSGRGTASRPIRLGLRHADGAISQVGLRPVRPGSTALARTGSAVLEGVYAPVPETPIERVAPAVWQAIAPHSRTSFRFDAVLAGPASQPHVFRATSTAPSPGTTLGARFAVVLFCCGPTYTSASLASLGVLSLAGVGLDAAGVLTLLVLVVGIVLTRTRGGVLGGAVGTCVALATTGRWRWIVLGAAVVAVATFAVVSGRSFTALNDSSNRVRTTQIRHHLTVFEHHPLTGYGVSHAEVMNVQAADETFVGLADAGGIGAVVLWLVAWLWPVAACLRRVRSFRAMVAAGAVTVWIVSWLTTGNEVLFGVPGSNLLPLVLAVGVAQRIAQAGEERA